jgi:archaellum component FlaC
MSSHLEVIPAQLAISAVEASISSNSEYPVEESLLEDCSSSNSQFPDKESLNLIIHYAIFGRSILKCIAKPMVYALLCIAVGFSPIRGFRACAIAVPVVAEAIMGRKENVKEGELIRLSSKGHEYSECTRTLLETVSELLRSIEKVRRGNGDIKEVEAAWKAVKSKKEELQRGIMSELYVQVNELKREKLGLEKRAEEIVDEVVKAKGEYERLVRKGQEEGKERVERLEENLRGLEEEYNRVWERVGEIEDGIARREFVVMSFAIRELCFIERECEQLVGRFTREIRLKGTDR